MILLCPQCRRHLAPNAAGNCPVCDSALVPNDTLPGELSSLAGSTFNQEYVLGDVVRRRAFSEVFEATASTSGRAWVEVFPRRWKLDRGFMGRLERVGAVGTEISHPNCAAVLKAGVSDAGNPFLVTQAAEGQPLREVMDWDAPFSTLKVLQVADHMCRGLGQLHRHGLVLGSLDPVAITVRKTTAARRSRWAAVVSPSIPVPAGWTAPGGTSRSDPRFSSYVTVDLLADQEVDGRSDLYCLGLLMYEMCTGTVPFRGQTENETERMHLQITPLAPRWLNGDLAEETEALILRLMARNKDRRPDSWHAVLEALAQIKMVVVAHTQDAVRQRGEAKGREVRVEPETGPTRQGAASPGSAQSTATNNCVDMQIVGDRRAAVRRPYVGKLHCYVEGVSRVAACRDISAGGALIDTTDDPPVGTRIAVVFSSQPGLEHPTYLLGVVVRRVPGAVPGVGVTWEKAVSMGTPLQLARFVLGLLGVRPLNIRRELVQPSGAQRAVFDFAELDQAALRAAVPEAADAVRPEEPLPVHVEVRRSGADPAVAEVPVPRAVPASAVSPAHEPGTITRRLGDSGLRVPTSVRAVVTCHGRRAEGRITHLGTTGFFVQLATVNATRGDEIKVVFGIGTRHGEVPVKCKCRVVAVDDGAVSGVCGLDVEIAQLDEGTEPGLLRDFVRWLYFRFVAE